MTILRALLIVCASLALACGPQRVVTQVAAPDLVVLLADADAGPVGGASVSNQFGTVNLEAERAASRIIPGQAPAPAVNLSEPEVNTIFGEALTATPLAPQHFVLYFRFESDELTDESRALLPRVLEAVAAYPAPEVAAVGHTDTSGDNQANYELGRNRATAVRNLLVGAGLDASLIEVTSPGEGDLLVATPDGTFEPRNRRVEIAVR
jgi:outer membrane protein OmpA-like peptidoglycan-associated protein